MYSQPTGGGGSWYYPTPSSTTVPIFTQYTKSTATTSTFLIGTNTVTTGTQWVQVDDGNWPPHGSPLRLSPNGHYTLPDGAKLLIDAAGNYQIEDSQAKVVYRANRVREFNPYINASDLLEHFIDDVGVMEGVDQGEILRLPIEAFIHWLILQAARRDGDPLDNLPSVESALPKAREPESMPAAHNNLEMIHENTE